MGNFCRSYKHTFYVYTNLTGYEKSVLIMVITKYHAVLAARKTTAT